MSKLGQHFRRGTAATTGDAEKHRPAPPGPPRRYDALTAAEVLAHLGELPAADLAKLADHERAHQNRDAVLKGIDALLGTEPWPGYDALDVSGVRSGLHGADRERLAAVLAYERVNKNRADVLLAAQQQPADGRA